MQWWDIYLRVPESLSDEASAYLQELGSTATVFHEQAVLLPNQEPCVSLHPDAAGWMVVQGSLPHDDQLAQYLTILQGWLHSVAPDQAGCQIHGRPAPDDDYLTRWREFFQPLCVGERLLIRPPWETAPVPDHLTCLTLNPGPAFGTGTHPSTRLCLLMLMHYAAGSQGSTLLDVGCGSGILSLAALHLGWQQALGVDIDTQALPVAVENATLNGLHDRVRFEHGSWQHATGPFPSIVANIFLGPLVEMLPGLAGLLTPGGTLVIAGILVAQEATMCLAATRAGLTVQHRLEDEGWVALALQHPAASAPAPSQV